VRRCETNGKKILLGRVRGRAERMQQQPHQKKTTNHTQRKREKERTPKTPTLGQSRRGRADKGRLPGKHSVRRPSSEESGTFSRAGRLKTEGNLTRGKTGLSPCCPTTGRMRLRNDKGRDRKRVKRAGGNPRDDYWKGR